MSLCSPPSTSISPCMTWAPGFWRMSSFPCCQTWRTKHWFFWGMREQGKHQLLRQLQWLSLNIGCCAVTRLRTCSQVSALPPALISSVENLVFVSVQPSRHEPASLAQVEGIPVERWTTTKFVKNQLRILVTTGSMAKLKISWSQEKTRSLSVTSWTSLLQLSLIRLRGKTLWPVSSMHISLSTWTLRPMSVQLELVKVLLQWLGIQRMRTTARSLTSSLLMAKRSLLTWKMETTHLRLTGCPEGSGPMIFWVCAWRPKRLSQE